MNHLTITDEVILFSLAQSCEGTGTLHWRHWREQEYSSGPAESLCPARWSLLSSHTAVRGTAPSHLHHSSQNWPRLGKVLLLICVLKQTLPRIHVDPPLEPPSADQWVPLFVGPGGSREAPGGLAGRFRWAVWGTWCGPLLDLNPSTAKRPPPPLCNHRLPLHSDSAGQ